MNNRKQHNNNNFQRVSRRHFSGPEESPMRKLVGPAHAEQLDSFISSHKSQMNAENFKKIMAQMTSRSAIQMGATAFCVLLTAAYFIAMTVMGGVYYQDAGNTTGIIPLAFVAAVPMGFMGVTLALAGVSFWTDEPDTMLGTSIGVIFAFVCFGVFSGIVYHVTTPINWSSCPSMDPPGTGMIRIINLFVIGNYTFKPLDPFNKDNILSTSFPPYFLWSDWLDLFRNTVAEIVCYNNLLFQFFWWCTMVFYFVGALVVVTVCINFYNRRKELSAAWEYAKNKLPMTKIGNQEFVMLNDDMSDEPVQVMQEGMNPELQPPIQAVQLYPTMPNSNYYSKNN